MVVKMDAIKAHDIQLVALSDIAPNPKNRNKHTPEQIKRLMAIIEYQGFRVPVVVSNRSGRLVAGHGRYLAAKELGLSHLPVIYQDFDSDEQEYAAGVSDNSIASWAELDLSGINLDVPDLGPDFDIDLLGIQRFLLEPADKFIEKDLETDLWADPEFDSGSKGFKIIITVESEDFIQQILTLLQITKVKNFKNLISVRWPEYVE